jgi:hypothetical protein
MGEGREGVGADEPKVGKNESSMPRLDSQCIRESARDSTWRERESVDG